MCIVFFSSHSHCTHHHLLGAWNCNLNCAPSARHIFQLHHSTHECPTCTTLDANQAPKAVTYYAPLFDLDKLAQDNEEAMQEEATDRSITAAYKALSDPESETSEWRREADGVQTQVADGGCEVAEARDQSPEMTPRKAAHKDLVRKQLEKLRVKAGGEFGWDGGVRAVVYGGFGGWGKGKGK